MHFLLFAQRRMVGLEETEVWLDEEMMKDDDVGDLDDKALDSGSKSEAEEVPLVEPAKNSLHNKEGLPEKLEDISWTEMLDS